MYLGASFYVVALALGHTFAFVLTCRPNPVLVENAGGDAYETPQCGCIKGDAKAKSECERFPLTLMITLCECIKGAPA